MIEIGNHDVTSYELPKKNIYIYMYIYIRYIICFLPYYTFWLVRLLRNPPHVPICTEPALKRRTRPSNSPKHQSAGRWCRHVFLQEAFHFASTFFQLSERCQWLALQILGIPKSFFWEMMDGGPHKWDTSKNDQKRAPACLATPKPGAPRGRLGSFGS